MEHITWGLIALLVFNYAISWWNAYATGKMWKDAQMVGGFFKWVVYSAAVMSACGFTMVYTFLLAFGLYLVGYLEPETFAVVMSWNFILIVVPVLASGAIITVHSWMQFLKTRSFLDLGVSAYNTWAMVHNVGVASEGIPKALDLIASAFKESKQPALIPFLLALIGLLGGILQTVVLVKKYAATVDEPILKSKLNLEKS